MRIATLAVFLSCASGFAASPTPAQRPEPPFVAKPASSARWAVNYSYTGGIPKDDSAALMQKALQQDPSLKLPWAMDPLATRYPLRKIVSVTGNIQQEETVYHDQSKAERWIINGLLVTPDPSNKKTYQVSTQSTSLAEPFAFREFAGLGWLNEKNFRGIQSLRGRPCFFFEREEPPVPENSGNPLRDARPVAPDAYAKASAWIDAETRTPVRLVVGPQVQDFEMLDAPASRLVVPEEVAKVWMFYAQSPLPKD